MVKNPKVTISPHSVEGNITIDIEFDTGKVTIHAHNDITQSIHILPDREIGFALNNDEYQYDGKSFKKFCAEIEKAKARIRGSK